jgi:hypothetical protein
MSIMDRLISYLESEHGDDPPSDADIVCAMLVIIREPSETMVLAGAKKVRGGTACDCAAATWRAMVDELAND